MGYTKGEWIVINGWRKDENGKYIDEPKMLFPSVLMFGTELQNKESMGRNSMVINVSHDQEIESLMANAKLISAAPNMLEVLKELLERIEPNQLANQDIWDKVKRAIKKATV